MQPKTGLDEQLREFESGVPKNLGNFPDELDAPDPRLAANAPETPEPPADPSDEPDAPPVAESADPNEGEDAPEPQQARPAKRDRLAELEERIATKDRELEFMRLAQTHLPAAQATPQAPPTDPIQLIDGYLGGFRVTPEDVNTILSDPAKGAEFLQNGIRAAIAAGAALALNQARNEYRTDQDVRQGATQLRDAFYGQHADLAPYAKLVQATAAEVRGQYPNCSAQQLIDETAKTVRGQLRAWNVPAVTPPSRRRQSRAPQGEMGTGSRTSGGRPLNPIERQMREFEAASTRFRQ